MEETGCLRSPPDARDYIYKGPKHKKRFILPDTLDYKKILPSIRNQQSQGTCAAQTGACIKEYHERMNIGYKGHMSPQFIYNHRVNYPSEGMYGRDVMQILKNIGVCRESTFVYGTMTLSNQIPSDAIEEAKNNKIQHYAAIEFIPEYGNKNIEIVKTALLENGPCWISFPCYSSEQDFWNKKNGQEFRGGHAVTIVGYNEKGFIIRNSWGNIWGDGTGHCIYSYEDFSKFKHWEIWTAVDDLSSVELPTTIVCSGCNGSDSTDITCNIL